MLVPDKLKSGRREIARNDLWRKPMRSKSHTPFHTRHDMPAVD